MGRYSLTSGIGPSSKLFFTNYMYKLLRVMKGIPKITSKNLLSGKFLGRIKPYQAYLHLKVSQDHFKSIKGGAIYLLSLDIGSSYFEAQFSCISRAHSINLTANDNKASVSCGFFQKWSRWWIYRTLYNGRKVSSILASVTNVEVFKTETSFLADQDKYWHNNLFCHSYNT